MTRIEGRPIAQAERQRQYPLIPWTLVGCLPAQLLSMSSEGGEDDLVEPFAGSLVDVGKDLTTHARFPETPDVIRHALHTFCLVGLRYEEISDAVRHLDEMVNVHGLLLALRHDALIEQLFLLLRKIAVLFLPF